MTAANSVAESPELELAITRIFDAPRNLVFQAWTDPQHMVRWWGPQGFTMPVCELDPRPGGAYRFCMHSPEGNDYWNKGILSEVVQPERLVMRGGWTDAEGNPTGPEMTTTITFEEHAGKTRLTLRTTGFQSIAARDSHRGGWSSSLEHLAEYLATA
ncbi:MAG: SRPBCC domain-containing protein [Candidatus Binataceae bacterium]